MSAMLEKLRSIRKFSAGRRSFLTKAVAAGVGAAAIGSVGSSQADAAAKIKFGRTKVKDADILNFALNLEYLEAEFYMRAVGRSLAASDTTGGDGTLGGTVTAPATTVVNFDTSLVNAIVTEIAADEEAHVQFIRAALAPVKKKDAGPVARPAIDLVASFTAAAIAAGVITEGQTFNPYADEDSFLLGAYIFEDVGVTAYKGAAAYIANSDYLTASAGILAVEAYHAGTIRTLLSSKGVTNANITDIANKIAALRDSADGDPADDEGITKGGITNIVPADANALAFSRTFEQVLKVVYLGGTTSGGFFPSGLNGLIK